MLQKIVLRRGLSTLIPPKVVSPQNLGSAPNAQRINKVVDFYKRLPQGSQPAAAPNGLVARYKAKYFDGDNAGLKPVVHLVAGILVLGYSMEYYFHLRHHKNGEH
ncbi:hypothetical protein TPHA_0J02650 [Tetrapisispora phaffii CBS 4417]|uniref:ATP synthase subunit f, mitochondrial n=1 Tax=Tetrapisispora phaffii (strain ATCC 24235 / CBS 4417 / NBRC 1672 / NRRL Y-8282 / UCD 70-5) TaxID=1071381 RepID=G8BYZ3_TETPH|nr:hypothetical protein TPHA_0J02650 [Tetrapisispora phaffii CBS 4417]CCE65085.1 hypothetical protein TPHA_0J02650 [Tetrapisispora phaffii CBS 4417]